MKPHVHQALIIQWANGAKIQYRKPDELVWKDSNPPAWVEDYEYRVKPAEQERVYPQTKMTDTEIKRAWSEIRDDSMLDYDEERRELINRGLRYAIDAGQVVTREEFDKLAAINGTLRKAIPINFD